MEDGKPVLDVCRAVAEVGSRFQTSLIDQRCCTNFSDQLFLGVCFAAKESGLRQAIQAGYVAGAVDQLMIDRAVILCGVAKLFSEGQIDGIVRGAVEGAMIACRSCHQTIRK